MLIQTPLALQFLSRKPRLLPGTASPCCPAQFLLAVLTFKVISGLRDFSLNCFLSPSHLSPRTALNLGTTPPQAVPSLTPALSGSFSLRRLWSFLVPDTVHSYLFTVCIIINHCNRIYRRAMILSFFVPCGVPVTWARLPKVHQIEHMFPLLKMSTIMLISPCFAQRNGNAM